MEVMILVDYIAFVGSDKVEYILWFSQILKKLGSRVLIADLSDRGDLAYCIDGECRNGELSSYCGVDFIRGNIKANNEYDYVLVDFGFRFSQDIAKCGSCIIFTDLQKHNVNRLKKLELGKKTCMLVVKDLVKYKVTPKYLIAELSNLNFGRDPYIVQYNRSNIVDALNCQYNNKSQSNGVYDDVFFDHLTELGFDEKSVRSVLRGGVRKWF